MVQLVGLAPAFTLSSLAKVGLGIHDTGTEGSTEQDFKERMLLEWQLGRIPYFFLLSEGGRCYSF